MANALELRGLGNRKDLENFLLPLSWEEAAQIVATMPDASPTKLASALDVEPVVAIALSRNAEFRRALAPFLVNTAFGIGDEIAALTKVRESAVEGQDYKERLASLEFLKKQGGTFQEPRKEVDHGGSISVRFTVDGGGTPNLGATETWAPPVQKVNLGGLPSGEEDILDISFEEVKAEEEFANPLRQARDAGIQDEE